LLQIVLIFGLWGRPQKTSAQNREKLTPSPCLHWFKPFPLPYFVCADAAIIFEKSEVLAPKMRTSASEESPLSEKWPHWTNPFPPPWLRTS